MISGFCDIGIVGVLINKVEALRCQMFDVTCASRCVGDS